MSRLWLCEDSEQRQARARTLLDGTPWDVQAILFVRALEDRLGELQSGDVVGLDSQMPFESQDGIPRDEAGTYIAARVVSQRMPVSLLWHSSRGVSPELERLGVQAVDGIEGLIERLQRNMPVAQGPSEQQVREACRIGERLARAAPGVSARGLTEIFGGRTISTRVAFEIVRGTEWDRKRSALCHSEFGNGVLGHWVDCARQDSLLEALAGGECASEQSVCEWEATLRRWRELKARFAEIVREAADGEGLIRSVVADGRVDEEAMRRSGEELRSICHLEDWGKSVLSHCESVDVAAAEVEQLLIAYRAGVTREHLSRDRALSSLRRLAECGVQLKTALGRRDHVDGSEPR